MTSDFIGSEASDITAEACAWIAQIESGPLTSADLDTLREWIGRSPRHAAALKRMAKLSMDANVLTEMAGPLAEAAAKYQTILQSRERPTFFRARWIALSAAIVTLVLTLLFFLAPNTGTEQLMVLTTPLGGYQETELSDGTVIKINTNSKVEVHYSNTIRKVRLLSGEAFFDISHDPDRPFLVYAGSQYVRAVGTAFVVRFLEESFAVSVVEGKVELAEVSLLPDIGERARRVDGKSKITVSSPPSEAPIALGAGYRATISEQTREVVKVSSRELQRELAWQEGLLDFGDTPLAEVIAELGRYSRLEVEFADPGLRDIRFGGIFRKGDPESFLDALEVAYGIDVEYLNEHKIRLSMVSDN